VKYEIALLNITEIMSFFPLMGLGGLQLFLWNGSPNCKGRCEHYDFISFK